MSKKRGRGLGRGLDELLSGLSANSSSDDGAALPDNSDFQNVPLASCQPSPFQPRRYMDDDALKELAQSIRTQGVIQPILVRPISAPSSDNKKYEIIAGERRWRAACQAEIGVIPALVKSLSDEACAAQALIENCQREDLNPIEQALALRKLLDAHDLSHESLAHMIGKSRSAISNQLRLLQLHPDVQVMLAERKIEMGHGKVLLALESTEQLSWALRIIKQHWSVRQTEQALRQHNVGEKNIPLTRPLAENWQARKIQLAETLKTKVHIKQQRSGKGQLIIHFDDQDALGHIFDYIDQE